MMKMPSLMNLSTMNKNKIKEKNNININFIITHYNNKKNKKYFLFFFVFYSFLFLFNVNTNQNQNQNHVCALIRCISKSLLQTMPFKFCFRINFHPPVFLILLWRVVKVEFGFKLGAVRNLPQVTFTV